MADDPKDKSAKDDPKDQPKDDPKNEPDDLGEAGKKALEKERRARRQAEKDAKDVSERLKAIEDKDKSEADKLRDERDDAVKARDEARANELRLQIATDKGLTPAQAKRLVGTTKEELEADADDFLESIKPDDKGTPSTKPRESLRGGGDPTSEPTEMDPRKLAEGVPRGF